MEIEFASPKGEYFYLVLAVCFFLGVIGLGWLGSTVTPVGNDGRATVLSWTDFQVAQAQKAYSAERDNLRQAVDDLADLVSKGASPVEVQIHVSRIEKLTVDGLPELADARAAISQASADVRDYSLGKISESAVIESINYAAGLLSK